MQCLGSGFLKQQPEQEQSVCDQAFAVSAWGPSSCLYLQIKPSIGYRCRRECGPEGCSALEGPTEAPSIQLRLRAFISVSGGDCSLYHCRLRARVIGSWKTVPRDSHLRKPGQVFFHVLLAYFIGFFLFT